MIVALAALAVGLLFWVPMLIILTTREQDPAFRCRFAGHDPSGGNEDLPSCRRCGVVLDRYEEDRGWFASSQEQCPRGPGFIDTVEGYAVGPGPMPDE